ncbi:MAG: hypothetical protein UV80_C0005G0044 [Candidatus Peregrinibacteria bacterium GW2011_GWF2_43_17]|nr:MAG: hypothetical protein UV80_C0005G0044 [Candidatus Peregrinibacteria bacterium GW2011_GWF2_43_17]KKT19670.1 MAG: hypothetical protein UW03_C0015G0046 [Candidatus Peregrinibacteria bacterium GW2011_GWA2_43_8]HAU40040.1 hypothetical protein [Candidatus Peregrinibacteria bacterium]
MSKKIKFLKKPILSVASVAIVAVLAFFAITPGNNLNSLNDSDYKIIDVHENIDSMDQADKLVSVMDAVNISQTVLVGSPEELLNYTGEQGFSSIEENNEEILSIANEYDERFYAFCAIDPDDADKVATAKKCIAEGGTGLKLYNGHTFFYEYPLDDDRLLPLYRYAEEEGVPMMIHVNTAYYLDQFEDVLTLYPDLQVVCPHFCLSSKNPAQLASLFNDFPNLYVDISFGYQDYLKDGLTRISENIDVFKDLFNKYGDRFLFGTVAVVTNDEEKTEEWLEETYRTYRDLLEKDIYTTARVTDEETGELVLLNGLALSADVLEKIYSGNWEGIMTR